MTKVIIVIPAYNVEKTLEKTYYETPIEFREKIVMVDDGSQDKTVQVAKKLNLKILYHAKNRGYGAAQKTLYKYALKQKVQIVVMLHGDNQYDPSLINSLIEPLQKGWLDIMMGNRIRSRKEALDGGMPLYKYLGNRFLTLTENLILGRNFGEYHNGLRAYKLKVLKTLPFDKFSDDFVFDQEFLASATYFDFKIGEIPCPVRYFPEASSISLKRSVIYGIRTLAVLMKFILDKVGIKKFPIFKYQKTY